MATDRTAKVTWQGSLMEGSGTIDSVGSGAFGPLDVTWASRAEAPDGRTSPEELIAAAWASCFSMALSHALARRGNAAGAARDVRHRHVPAGRGDREGRDHGRGTVPGLDHAAFLEHAEGAKENCPVSKALTGIPEVTLDATLADGVRGCPRLGAWLEPGAWRIQSSPWRLDQLVDELERSYAELQERMADPAVYTDHREAADARPAPEGARAGRQRRPRVAAARRPTSPRRRTTPSSRRWRRSSRRRSTRLEDELKLALVERDPADAKDVIVEVRQGVGGDEAALWAGEVARMLQRYAERRGFRTETLSASENDGGGVKETVFAVKGDGAFSVFKWEGGTHRVQRVPATESQGRIHTSTATVAVMPEAEEVEVDDRGQGPEDRRLPLDRPRRPVGQHDGLGRADHARADRASWSRCRTRSRSSRTSRRRCACSARGSTRPSASASRPSWRRAALAGRHRRARGEDPHLQLPGEPAHRPPRQAHGAPARPDPRRRPPGVHRGAPGRGAPPRARGRRGREPTSTRVDSTRAVS